MYINFEKNNVYYIDVLDRFEGLPNNINDIFQVIKCHPNNKQCGYKSYYSNIFRAYGIISKLDENIRYTKEIKNNCKVYLPKQLKYYRTRLKNTDISICHKGNEDIIVDPNISTIISSYYTRDNNLKVYYSPSTDNYYISNLSNTFYYYRSNISNAINSIVDNASSIQTVIFYEKVISALQNESLLPEDLKLYNDPELTFIYCSQDNNLVQYILDNPDKIISLNQFINLVESQLPVLTDNIYDNIERIIKSSRASDECEIAYKLLLNYNLYSNTNKIIDLFNQLSYVLKKSGTLGHSTSLETILTIFDISYKSIEYIGVNSQLIKMYTLSDNEADKNNLRERAKTCLTKYFNDIRLGSDDLIKTFNINTTIIIE